MIHTGLVSVTFRKLGPADIVELVTRAGLDAIEWGGDVHVPHGDLDAAESVRRLTADAGLRVASYGSYCRAGCESDASTSFDAVLRTAEVLQAPNLRVWAGNRDSTEADDAWWDSVVKDTRRIAALTEAAGMTLSFEFHGGTLTDTAQSAERFATDVDHPNLRLYWQPDQRLEFEARRDGLRTVLPWLGNVHVFHWEGGKRRALADGGAEWRDYFGSIRGTGRDHYALMEFVADDDPEAFLRDAATLKRLLAGTGE